MSQQPPDRGTGPLAGSLGARRPEVEEATARREQARSPSPLQGGISPDEGSWDVSTREQSPVPRQGSKRPSAAIEQDGACAAAGGARAPKRQKATPRSEKRTSVPPTRGSIPNAQAPAAPEPQPVAATPGARGILRRDAPMVALSGFHEKDQASALVH